MAFSAIRANKMRSFLTMLGIIIGIGSVISIVSIGDTMRSMFADLYRNIGLTQAYIAIGYFKTICPCESKASFTYSSSCC